MEPTQEKDRLLDSMDAVKFVAVTWIQVEDPKVKQNFSNKCCKNFHITGHDIMHSGQILTSVKLVKSVLTFI